MIKWRIDVEARAWRIGSGLGRGSCVMIAFRCGNCGHDFQVDDGLAGKKGRCKTCGAGFTVPGSPSAQAAASAPVRSSNESAKRPSKPSRGPQPAAFNPFEDEELLPTAAPVKAADEPVLTRTRTAKAPGRKAANQGPFVPALRRAVVGFFLLFFILGAPSVSLERRFVPGGKLPNLPFGTIPTDLGPAATALACTKLIGQLSVVLCACSRSSRSRARCSAFCAGTGPRSEGAAHY